MGTPSPALPSPRTGDDPAHWTGTSPLLDLEDTKLRLRVQGLVQLRTSERHKALALYGYVKRLPLAQPFKMRLHTAREVLDAGRGDPADKATLLVAMCRLAGLPARMRFLSLRDELFRGLPSGMPEPTRPLVEMFLGGHWIRTDTFIFDAAYFSAARERLVRNGWEWGYGIHARGQMLWDGDKHAFASGFDTAADPMVAGEHGVFCDPLEFVSSPAYRAMHTRFSRALHANLVAPAMDRAIRDLRFDPRFAADAAAPQARA